MRFNWHKYHALRNDFIVIESSRGNDRRFCGRLAKAICDRHSGVGADGILVLTTTKSSLSVYVYNADGSWAEISGNGARIAAFHASRARKQRVQAVAMGKKLLAVTLRQQSQNRANVAADIGVPEFDTRKIPVNSKKRALIQSPFRIRGVSFPITAVSVGNPHVVLFVDSFEFDWHSVGKLIETAKEFPNRTNVEFVRVVSPSILEVRLWERGVGETDSSGTGAAASLVAAVVTGRANRTSRVVSPAGTLKVTWDSKSGGVSVDGPVNFVAAGSFDLS